MDFLKFQHTSSGWDNIGAYRPKQLCSTVLGRLSIVNRTAATSSCTSNTTRK